MSSKTEEAKLISKAEKALRELEQFRMRRCSELRYDASVDEVATVARLNAWPSGRARVIARLLLKAGLTADGARRLLDAAEERPQ